MRYLVVKNCKDRKGGGQGMRGGENRELLFNSYRISVLQDQKIYGDG